MPRVTDAHRERQTARILRAAEECFARSGFRATSMDEVIAAAGMSSSTVYRYFPEGKRSLMRTVLARRMRPLTEWIGAMAESSDPLDFEQGFIEALVLLNYERDAGDTDAVGLSSWAPLAYHAWGELTRDPEMHEMVRQNHEDILRGLTRLCRNGQEVGTISDRLTAEQTASLILSISLGLIVENLITGHADVERAAETLGRLLAPKTRGAQDTSRSSGWPRASG